MTRLAPFALLCSLLVACATAVPTVPNEREILALLAEAEQIESLRRALPQPAPGMSRRAELELHLENQKRLEGRLETYLARVKEYMDRTGDPRAARLWANEHLRLGDAYMNVLSRYERAIEMYQRALSVDPANEEARKRIDLAQSRRFVSIDAFAGIRDGMSESDVESRLGQPREDWIKHVRQDQRLFSVWIYPRSDGAAAAVYFDNGIVYHTNWNAAVSTEVDP
ncbi:MAG TPA: tetratricopeptide repeat protein [Thermoanaerobaculia bacterium]|nr:tetratricopeptide repeat protein [Thermoanaerobaculia bacterium]